ncbi:hypothetical protein Tco_1121100 [Tanacetum coccineum]|uniref:Uncharacterized protein n=1 Tax=Tanacetum coccineum TaxID=301880 RepID=A0ABQ5IY94_9ASTR
MRIEFNKPQIEPIYQVTLDVLKLSSCYPAFLITIEVPEIYMHQFWNTIKKIKDTDAYQFKLDKQKFQFDTEVFREILQICPRLPNQDFVGPPSEEEIVPFIKELGYTGKCLDRLRPSRAQILWGMNNKKNVDFFALQWEDFMFQADNRDISPARKENMPYPRFTKVIINHFISKDKTISMRNMINLHTIRDDTLLDSKAYKIYLAFASGKATPKKARKFKKIASPSEKQTLFLQEEPAKKPKETPGVYVSKKKAPATTDRSKGIDLLPEATLLKDAQMKKVPDELQDKMNGTNEGISTITWVPDVPKDQSKSENEYWGESGDDNDNNDDDNYDVSEDDGNDDDSDDVSGDADSDSDRTESDEDENPNLNQNDDDIEEEYDDEYVRTLSIYESTDDENEHVDEEEYDRIDNELYKDVNVKLNDVEQGEEGKGDVEKTL